MNGTKQTWKNAMKAAVMTGALALMGSLSVQAAESIDMSTTYPGISLKSGESADFDLFFESLTGESYDAKLLVESMPEGWEGYFKGGSSEINMVHIGAAKSEEELATFKLSLPEGVEEGNYTVKLKADAGSGDNDVLELEVLVSELENGQSNFITEYPEQQGASGTSFSFDATLVNNKAAEQSYSLSAKAESGWQVGFVPSGESTQVASVTLESGASQGMTIDVTPPATITEGEYVIPVTAISASEKMSIDLKVIITGSYEVNISTPTGNLSVDTYANEEKAVILSITNTGNVDLENLNLTSSASTDWEVRFDESTIDLLEAGSTKELTAYVKPAENSIIGDYVTAITISNAQTTDTVEFRVSVKTRTTWGMVAAAIIVLLILGLGRIFKKYGRR